jgi:hypothetical protein
MKDSKAGLDECFVVVVEAITNNIVVFNILSHTFASLGVTLGFINAANFLDLKLLISF